MSDPLHYSRSPLLASVTPMWRSKLLVALMAFGFMAVLLRAGYIQLVNVVADDGFYLKEGEKRFVRKVTLPAVRGQIMDRNGVTLAQSVQASSVWLVPRKLTAADRKKLPELARLLGVEMKWLQRRIDKILKGRTAENTQSSVQGSTQSDSENSPELEEALSAGDGEKWWLQRTVEGMLNSSPEGGKESSHAGKGDNRSRRGAIRISRQVSEETAAAVTRFGISAVELRREYRRWYPDSEAFVQVVGLTDLDGRGAGGMELAMQSRLEGVPGSRRVIKNGLAKPVEDVGYAVPAKDGEDIVLSLDSKVQHQAYAYLKQAVQDTRARAGSLVVLDVRTGEVLAMASYPSFNPTDRAWRRRLSTEQLSALTRNRALRDQMEPGSTMKPFTVAAALDKGSVRPGDSIDTGKGRLKVGRHVISDTKKHGVISVSEVVQFSSNVGTVKIAQKIPAYDMWRVFSYAGFGQSPGLELPAASGALRPYKEWKEIEKYTMGYGYGLSASVFQLAHAYSVFANDGRLIPATLFKSSHRRPGVQVIDAATARDVRQMLYSVVQEKGTAPQAQPAGYYVGGKTGTAYKVENKKYNRNKYRSFFAGLAPINQPRLAVAVMIDEPERGRHYGGKAAAPVFASIVQYTLNRMGVPPDRSVDMQQAGQEAATVAYGRLRPVAGGVQ